MCLEKTGCGSINGPICKKEKKERWVLAKRGNLFIVMTTQTEWKRQSVCKPDVKLGAWQKPSQWLHHSSTEPKTQSYAAAHITFSQTQSFLSCALPEVSLAGCVPLLTRLKNICVFALSKPEVKPPLFHWSQPAVVLGGGRPLSPTAGVNSTWPAVCLLTHSCSRWSHDGVWL